MKAPDGTIDCRAGESGSTTNKGNSSPPQLFSIQGGDKVLLSLVQVRKQQGVFLLKFVSGAHSSSIAEPSPFVTPNDLRAPMWLKELPKQDGVFDDYRLLVNELMRLMLAKQLFTFVTANPIEQPNGEIKPVAGTNNEAERTLRNPAQARKTGRTNKTASGARRQSILTSVLESLRLYLATYTLQSVIDEVNRWTLSGRSCFEDLMAKLGLNKPTKSILDTVIVVPDG